MSIVEKGQAVWRGLPPELRPIREAIETSQDILGARDPDTEETVSAATWERAAGFLARYAEWVWREFEVAIEAPEILPGPDRSVDIHWDVPGYELLINIPAAADRLAGFYGDSQAGTVIKGKFDTRVVNQGLVLWLMQRP
jgi:hypothetical protein